MSEEIKAHYRECNTGGINRSNMVCVFVLFYGGASI